MRQSSCSLVWMLRGLALAAVLGLLLVAALTVWTVRRHDIKLLSVQSGSMEPTIKTGDAVLIRDVAPQALSVGDVISYRTAENGAITTHRVHTMRPTAERPVTKGDANDLPDGQQADFYLEGQAIAVAPYAGRIASLLQTPMGLIIFIYIPATVVVLYEARRLQRNLRKPYRLLK